MTSRDRSGIEKAFPSRAQTTMRNLQSFHERVVALAAEGSARRTSSPSPSRPSAAQRQQLTGVRENTDGQGWISAVSMPHLCFPPDQYPQGAGPGSRWNCRCDAVWEAQGLAWEDYPTTPKRLELLKPERWFYREGGQLPAEDYKAQEGLYDWRPLGPYYVKLYRAMVDNQLASQDVVGVNFVDWRDLG